jgi:hypothetical protein
LFGFPVAQAVVGEHTGANGLELPTELTGPAKLGVGNTGTCF